MVELDRRLPDVQVAQIADRQWGVLSLGELRECGLSRDAIALRVANGRLHPRYRAVYAVGHAHLSVEGCFLAAVKACGEGAWLSHFAAAALFELVTWDYRDPDVTVLGVCRRLHPGIRVHRTSSLGPADLSTHRGIPVTSPARTLIDLASIVDYRALRRAVRQALSLKLVDIPTLAAMMRAMRGRRGLRKLAKILATGMAPTRSDLEDIVLDVILSGGFDPPDVNVPLFIEGRRVVPDFRWSDQRLVVEADSRTWHDNKIAREDDAERQALLEAFGERVLRVTWRQAVAQPRQTIARLSAAGAPIDRTASLSG